MRWDIILLVMNTPILAFNLWVEGLPWSSFSAMAMGMLMGSSTAMNRCGARLQGAAGHSLRCSTRRNGN